MNSFHLFSFYLIAVAFSLYQAYSGGLNKLHRYKVVDNVNELFSTRHN